MTYALLCLIFAAAGLFVILPLAAAVFLSDRRYAGRHHDHLIPPTPRSPRALG